MDKEVKARWLEALRSGKFEQGLGRFKTSNGKYCCLGVLCAVEKPAGWDEARRHFFDMGSTEYSLGTIPYTQRNRWQISDEEHDHLVEMNDFEEKSFNEIADYIERNL